MVEDAPDGEVTKEEFDRALEQAAAQHRASRGPASPTTRSTRRFATPRVRPAARRWIARRGRRARHHGLRPRGHEPAGADQRAELRRPEGVRAVPRSRLGFTPRRTRSSASSCCCSATSSRSTVIPDGAERLGRGDRGLLRAPTRRSSAARDARRAPDRQQGQAKVSRRRPCSSGRLPGELEEGRGAFSTEDATKDSGGLVEGVTAGQSEPALEEQLFAADEGELVGPFERASGLLPDPGRRRSRPRRPRRSTEVSEQIEQQLVQAQAAGARPAIPGGLRGEVDVADLLRRRAI